LIQLGRRLLVASVVLIGLAACAQQPLRDSTAGGEATGQLGSPLVQPSPADVYIDLSGAYLREENYTEAFKNAKKAVLVDPESSNAYLMQALVYRRLGEDGEAEKSFKRSIRLDPRNPAALNAYGTFLCGRDAFQEADGYFRRALNNPLYNTPWLALHNAGRCLERAGDEDSAERDYREALQANPMFAPSLLGMARISYEQTNYLSARAYLQRYAEVAQHTPESLWLGVRTENQLGDRDQMASYGLKLRAKFPDSQQAKYLQSIE
jgi:type IV pilus assembly protein PilF